MENLNLQGFCQAFSIHSLLGESKSEFECVSHLKYGEVGYALRHLDSRRLRWPLHTAGEEEKDARGLSQQKRPGDRRRPREGAGPSLGYI